MKWFNPTNEKITADINHYNDIQALNKKIGKHF